MHISSPLCPSVFSSVKREFSSAHLRGSQDNELSYEKPFDHHLEYSVRRRVLYTCQQFLLAFHGIAHNL